MKKIIYTLSALALTLSACVPLDTPPYDRETDLTFWSEDKNAAEEALNTCYTYLTDMYELVYSDGMSDNAYVKGGQNQAIGNGKYGTSDGYVYDVWNRHYAGIRACNELLKNIDLVPELSDELKARYVAEARTPPAWNYYELYVRFGGVPYLTEPISIAEARKATRETAAAIAAHIEEELEEVIASNALPASYGAADKGRVTKWTAAAILARTYLFEGKFEKVNQEFTKVQIFTGRVISFFTPLVMMVMMGLSLSILWASAFVINGLQPDAANLAFSQTNAFVMLASQIVMSFILIVTLIVVWPRASVSAKRIEEVITHEVSILDTDHPVEFKEKGTIEFKNVGFAYPGSDKEAVSGISFKVKQGEVIAFIGATGSGKTTIINMIPRMADCTSGEVLVDGVNVKDVLQKDLRDRIGYAPQRGFLFKGIIKDNIAFKNPDMTLADVRWAAEIADADGFVMGKRNGYDSEVAQGGTNFSGGQKQRLCIARAVATKPEILIFDDSFSALDYRTDKIVRGRIAEKLPEATRVIIAQRVGTIMDADQIVVLDHGKMVGIGKHKDLIRNCPVYQEIALSQLSKEELGL